MYLRRSRATKGQLWILANATHLRGFLEENAGTNFQFDLYKAQDVER